MLHPTLSQIKSNLKELLPVIDAYMPIAEPWFDILTAMRVSIRNAAGDTSMCFGYSTKKDIEEIQATLKWLQAVKYQIQFHFISYIVREVEFAVDGPLMSDDNSHLLYRN